MIVLLEKLNKYWFILIFFIILLTVFFLSFFKIIVLKDFIIFFPENCDSLNNNCVVYVDEEDAIPTRFIVLKENYFLKNCKNKDFDECLVTCSIDNMCTLEKINIQDN